MLKVITAATKSELIDKINAESGSLVEIDGLTAVIREVSPPADVLNTVHVTRRKSDGRVHIYKNEDGDVTEKYMKADGTSSTKTAFEKES